MWLIILGETRSSTIWWLWPIHSTLEFHRHPSGPNHRHALPRLPMSILTELSIGSFSFSHSLSTRPKSYFSQMHLATTFPLLNVLSGSPVPSSLNIFPKLTNPSVIGPCLISVASSLTISNLVHVLRCSLLPPPGCFPSFLHSASSHSSSGLSDYPEHSLLVLSWTVSPISQSYIHLIPMNVISFGTRVFADVKVN